MEREKNIKNEVLFLVFMRIMTAAYLFNDDQILMLKRSKDRQLAANLWTGIGGHVEADEYNNPEQACLREVFEETGINEHEISNLELRYILFRRDENEIRQHYIYFGETSKVSVNNTSEGELHWIKIAEIEKLEVPLTVGHMLKHFFTSPDENMIFIGSINDTQIEWSHLKN
ncbi:MAG: NUDIX domain-containing protein [Solibacillus sp.]